MELLGGGGGGASEGVLSLLCGFLLKFLRALAAQMLRLVCCPLKVYVLCLCVYVMPVCVCFLSVCACVALHNIFQV